ncbi:MAG: transglutaminase family protein [Anaeromyxobacter sp.]|nr:transglutaminase family protein [Anaeromyxobacter sp.]
MRILLQHQSVYRYPVPAALGPHQIRLRPASHVRARVEHYSLKVPESASVRWQQDPFGNHVAHLSFRKGTRLAALEVLVELAVDIRPVNPFDFFLDDRCEQVPFTYPAELRHDLAPFLDRADPAYATGPRFEELLQRAPAGGPTVDYVVALNQLVNQAVRYVIREEAGLWTPEETLAQGRGSCRDQAVLLIALFRARGLAARFASGYLLQLADEGMLPDEPKGVSRDVADLHAWCEVYLPGGGWIGLDPTSGLFAGEGHIPLASVAHPALAAPLEGTSDQPAVEVSFSLKVGRLGHEVRPTAPFPEAAWGALLAGADRADAALAAAGLSLTSGGEPTLNSREHADLPEWNGEALGTTKWAAGLRLAAELRTRLLPGSAVLARPGKWYPGESLPRWALELIGRADGLPVWEDLALPAGPVSLSTARTFAGAVATALGLPSQSPTAAFEDPWRLIQEEAGLPVDVDPLKAKLSDPEERRRLARQLGADPTQPVGYALPLAHSASGGGWRTERWKLRRDHLFLVPGDSPMGLRLPLAALGGPVEVLPVEPALPRPDPRRAEEEEAQARQLLAAARAAPAPIRTTLCVERRDGTLFVFLPPTATVEEFLALVKAVDEARRATGIEAQLEGYPPPSSPLLSRLAVTPDPGVLEVNLPPQTSGRAHAAILDTVFEAGLHAGLHSEKWLLDGRLAGSGGGHHVTVGGPTPLESPLVRRPDLLASLITFTQHHPSLSFLFSGLFVGPTSQAPRVDEARLETLSELEIALAGVFAAEAPDPWLGDLLFRNLLTDLTGNTHRAELSIDKLWDWRTPHGRQGVVEFRAFEMPPHPRLAAAQALLVRSLVAAFARGPYRRPLVRWGAALHDRFMLPHFLWKDFQEVLAFLEERGVGLPPEPYRAFVELRCPVAGHLEVDGLVLEVRNALEPWNVLGEEPSGGGTSRYVDSSLERVEVRVDGLQPDRHRVLVNGIDLPMRPTGTAGEQVGGVRFRAWAPAHALHPHLGIHHPLTFELLDTWGRRSLGACRYHVWHPEGRAYLTPPLTRFEASARRAQRFTLEGASPWPVAAAPAERHAETPYSLDLRLHPGDRPMPEPEDPAETDGP